jgi:hypothetical protein
MDGWTDEQGDSYIPPPNFVCGEYKKLKYDAKDKLKQQHIFSGEQK